MSDWLNDLENVFHAFTNWVRSLRVPPIPGTGSVSNKREHLTMADIWLFDIDHPAASTAPDWDKRLVHVTVDGASQPDIEVTPKEALQTLDAEFPEDAHVELTWEDYDNRGNTKGPGTSYAFDVNDDVGPAVAGVGGVSNKREKPAP